MQFQQSASPASVGVVAHLSPVDTGGSVTDVQATSFGDYKVIRRNGAVVAFEPSKIAVAMTKAFIAVHGGQGAASAAIREQVEKLTASVVTALMRRQPAGGTFHIEDVQDQVELSLMRDGAHDVARSYVLYRERRSQERAATRQATPVAAAPPLAMIEEGRRVPLDMPRIESLVRSACEGLSEFVTPDAILSETFKNLYDGVPLEEVYKSAILAARALIEKDPAYSYVTARLLLHTMRREALGEEVTQPAMAGALRRVLPEVHPLWHRGRAAGRQAGAVRPEEARPGTEARARPAVQLPRPADAVRPLFPAPRRPSLRAAAGVLHARGDGPGAERDRPRGARDRVLRGAVDVRLHELDADAVQRRARATRSCRPAICRRCRTISTASTRRSRKTRCWPSTPAGWATTGRRCGRSAAISRAPTARARAWCRS